MDVANLSIERGELISQGAEGKIYRSIFLTKPCIEKVRVSKRYRVMELDKKLNKQRILQESRCMVKCLKAGIQVPTIYHVDITNYTLYMEFIEGQTVKDFLKSHQSTGHTFNYILNSLCQLQYHIAITIIMTGYQGECIDIARNIGEIIGKIHDKDVVHGDLTTSNIMIRDNNQQLVVIDFGLGSMQAIIEDKAVDLYVLERALISTHPGCDHLITAIYQAYRFACRQGTLVLMKLDQVRQRGRKREMFG